MISDHDIQYMISRKISSRILSMIFGIPGSISSIISSGIFNMISSRKLMKS
jgi:hypothetical protein